jgi:hypothetical protein
MSPQQTIAPYRIAAKLGDGGMAKVEARGNRRRVKFCLMLRLWL